jgi:hypothetical protein
MKAIIEVSRGERGASAAGISPITPLKRPRNLSGSEVIVKNSGPGEGKHSPPFLSEQKVSLEGNPFRVNPSTSRDVLFS